MNKKIKISILTGTLVLAVMISCKDEFLTYGPKGVVSEAQLTTKFSADKLLVSAYRTLNGTNVGAWYTSPMNWVWGSVRSGESYKGSEAGDQNQLNPIERYESIANNASVQAKWDACYDGVWQSNLAIRAANEATDLSENERTQVLAEARFLRGFHHFEAKRTFDNVPYVDETKVSEVELQSVKNDVDIYPQIEADLQFAYDNLPPTQPQVGRVNKWAAGAFLAKALLYQKKYAAAKAVFDVLIASGTNNAGVKYALLPKFSEVFRGANEHSSEVVFGVETIIGDNTGGANSTLDAELTNPHNSGPGGCCGFYQPSQSFANSFKTVGGLPDPNPHADPINQQESDPTNFPYRGELDPRIDHTVGRVGIQYLDWGPASASWIRFVSFGGPFLPKKNVHTSAELGTYQAPGPWGQSQSGRNILVMRYSDMLLMAAECEVEVGSLAKATEYVNMIRTRAANAADFVDATTAYTISNYPPFTDKATALAAIKKERLLELGMEGHRMFDLVRWGDAEAEINAYIAREQATRTHLKDASFDAEDLYLPIPQFAISRSNGALTD
jgi:hypothetical protein